MRTRLIEPIGKRLRILFQSGKQITLSKLHSIHAELDDIESTIHWKILIDNFGPRLGWGLDTVYNNESGKPQPGDMFWFSSTYKNFDWDNFEGPELHVILPNGIEWNIDSHANNCDMKDDRFHRCWIRHGEPPNITVDKKGITCHAGAGSIQGGDYHGFLTNGEFKP